LVALQDIEQDEELFCTPQSAVLSVKNSGLRRVQSEIFDFLGSWHSLVLAMINEDGQRQKSMWWHYLNILPTSFDTLLYWSPSELAELQGSAVIDKIGKEDADRSFVYSLLPLVKGTPELWGMHAEAFRGRHAESLLLKVAHRMATLIMAYGFDLDPESRSSEEEDEEYVERDGGSSQSDYDLKKGMLPLADLINADGDLNNVW